MAKTKFDFQGQDPNDRLQIMEYDSNDQLLDTYKTTIGEFIEANMAHIRYEDPRFGQEVLDLRRGQKLTVGGGAGVTFVITRLEVTPLR